MNVTEFERTVHEVVDEIGPTDAERVTDVLHDGDRTCECCGQETPGYRKTYEDVGEALTELTYKKYLWLDVNWDYVTNNDLPKEGDT